MENRRRSIKGEIQLPEDIIQHIQSFLNGKESAQTSILSKSWYSAWSTHPDVDFDQRYFAGFPAVHEFPEFARSTLQRYENLNQKIKSLKLWMYCEPADGYNSSLANELIAKAIELGASDLHLQFQKREPPFVFSFVIPKEVLGSAALTRLSLYGCTVERGVDGMVNCSRLKSLCLDNVMVGEIIWDIISKCPLIEKLTITGCVYKSKAPLHIRMLSLSPNNSFGRQILGTTFRKLKYLFLELIDLKSSFFTDFSSRFPCLKDLSVHDCFGYEKLHVFSNSLECISFVEKHDRTLRARFDVPSIRKFSFSGTYVPVLSFQTTSSEWESDISFLDGEPGDLSVPKLKKLLKKLRQSKISLSLNIVLLSDKNFEYVGDIGDSPRPVVENLILMMPTTPSSVCAALLGCLFWSCRPKFITPYTKGKVGDNTVEILCKRLIQLDQNCYIANRRMFGQCDLEEVTVECFEEAVGMWRPLPWKSLLVASEDPKNKQMILPWKSLLDASEGPKNNQILRFVLRWGE